MSSPKIEVEIRAYAPRNIIQKLQQIGAKKIAESSQRDEYYLFKEGFIFRIRNNQTFTIKANVDNRDNGWYEWESDVKNTKGLSKILLQCGFKLFGVVAKNRIKYEFQDFEINIDKVRGLGNFIEVELLALNKDQGLKIIKSFLYSLGIKKLIHKGYINIMRDKDKNK